MIRLEDAIDVAKIGVMISPTEVEEGVFNAEVERLTEERKGVVEMRRQLKNELQDK